MPLKVKELTIGYLYRGGSDNLITCVDGSKGFPESIATIFPDAKVQECIIHKVRNSIKYVASKHQRAYGWLETRS